MKIKMLASIALLGLSVSSAQAITLKFSDSHTADGEVDHFKFNVNNTGSVSLWTDTLQDGFHSTGSLFKLNSATGKYDFTNSIADGSQPDFDEVLGYNTTGLNEFGVRIKNGYIQNDPEALGKPDAGRVLNLDKGTYIFAVTGFAFISEANFNGEGTLDDRWFDMNLELFGAVDPEAQWSTWRFNTGGDPSPYDVFIEGDVSAVSDVPAPVPVPAAVWLFASAIAGLGVVGKRKEKKLVA